MIDFSKDEVLMAIYPYIKGKEILDVGCIDHDLKRKHRSRIWVHDFLKENGKSLEGIDILRSEIEKLKKQNYNVSCQNAESFKFDRKFEVIFAGELIEHLSNPGLFLERCKKHLEKNGLLILTTPNTFCAFRWIEMIYNKTNDPHASKAREHTMWFSPEVMTVLLERAGFEIKKYEYASYPFLRKESIKRRLIKTSINFLGKKFKDTLIVFAKLK
jgi:2-polyprenyl-3-methyl-5-hydroxy-6-metoxy-1,4-benzoquinol methylase